VCYLDFVKDVDEIVDILQNGFKAGKYIGKMRVEDKRNVDSKFRQGSISAIGATVAYKLGVDNQNINQVV